MCCGVGAYTARNSVFDIFVCLLAGVLGWAMQKRGLPAALISIVLAYRMQRKQPGTVDANA